MSGRSSTPIDLLSSLFSSAAIDAGVTSAHGSSSCGKRGCARRASKGQLQASARAASLHYTAQRSGWHGRQRLLCSAESQAEREAAAARGPRTRHAHGHDGHHVGVSPVDVLQQARKLQLVRGVADFGEAAQLTERLHVPVPNLHACAWGGPNSVGAEPTARGRGQLKSGRSLCGALVRMSSLWRPGQAPNAGRWLPRPLGSATSWHARKLCAARRQLPDS